MRADYRLKILIFFLVLIYKESAGQANIERNFTVSDGLPSNYVYSVIQDYKGFLWFATNNGVSRFDGKEFKNFSADEGLPDNDIVNLVEDAAGRIWLSCFNSVPCYIQHNRIVVGDSLCKIVQMDSKGYFRFAKSGEKVIMTWSTGGDWATQIDINGTLTHVDLKGGGEILMLDEYIVPINQLYIGNFRLYKNYKLMDHAQFWNSPRIHESPVIVISPGVWDKKRFAVFMKDHECLRYEIINEKIMLTEKFKTAFPISKIYNYNNKLWAQVSNDSIVPVNKQFAPDRLRQTLFSNKLIQYFFIDNEENAWACTAGNGVFMIPSKKVRLYDIKNGLLSNNIQKLFSFGKEIYIGFNNTDVQVLKNKELHTVDKEKMPSQGKMRCLYVDSSYILFSTLNDGFIFSKSNRKCFKLPCISPIKYISKSQDNNVWIGSSAKCWKLRLPATMTDTINCGRVSCLLERSNGEVLIGSLHGILVCRKDESHRWLIDSFKAPVSLKDLSISFIEEYGNTLVIGTSQKGLLLIRDKQYEFVNGNGMLKNANCRTVSIDKSREIIWVATFSGLFKIKLKGNIHQYDIENVKQSLGLPSLDINDFKIVNDTAYLGSSQGLFVFPVNETYFNKHSIPSAYINDIVVNDTIQMEQRSPFKLKPGENSIEFRFSGIDYKSLGNILFRYRLIGLRNDWQYTTQNSVRYESLPPGEYLFEMAAMNTEQKWSSVSTEIGFFVSPFWWQTNLFQLLALLVFTMIVLIVSRSLLTRKHKIQLNKASIKRHIAEAELKALKAQINPHFIFNTLNAIQYFITNGKADLADSYLGKLSKLLRKTLDFSNKTSVNLEEEVQYIDNYLQLEKLRFEENFSYTIENDVPTEKAQLPIPPMVLQPHIENALRHAFKGRQHQDKRITIRFRVENNELICEVEDNGIGRQASLAGKGIAHAEHVSHGQELSSSKLYIYEQLAGKKVSTSIIDKEDEGMPHGTLVVIRLAI